MVGLLKMSYFELPIIIVALYFTDLVIMVEMIKQIGIVNSEVMAEPKFGNDSQVENFIQSDLIISLVAQMSYPIRIYKKKIQEAILDKNKMTFRERKND